MTVKFALDRAGALAFGLSTAPVSADLRDGEYYADIVLFVDGEGYLSCLEAYAAGDEAIRRSLPAEQINARPHR